MNKILLIETPDPQREAWAEWLIQLRAEQICSPIISEYVWKGEWSQGDE